MDVPDAAMIEILQTGPLKGAGVGSVIAPDQVRINGIPLLAADRPIIIHEIHVDSNDVVLVTITLFARRVIIGAELHQP